MEMKKYKLGEICKLNRSSLKKTDSFDKILYLDTSSITENKIELVQSFTLEEAPSRAQRKVENNTIIFSTVRPNQKHFGILNNPEKNLIVSSGFTTIDVNNSKEIYPLYLYHKLTQPCIVDYLQTIAQNSVSSYPSINPDDIGNLSLTFPAFSDQQKIAAVLSSLDDKIALNNRINAKLEQMTKRLYDYWFVQFDFPNADGKQYKSTGGKMVWNEELKREIPEGWEVKKLGEILILLKDGTHNPPKRQEKGIPLLTGTMFGNNFLDYDKATYISEADYKIIHSQYEPHENDVIITKIGTLGNVNLLRNIDIPLAIHCNSALLRFDMALGVYYPFSYCKSDLFKMRLKAIKGQSIQEFASLDRISSIKSEVPCVDIINKFDKIVKPIIEKQKSISFENKKLKEMRDKLLPLLMNGQVVVK